MKKNEQLFEMIGDIKEEYVNDAMNDPTIVVKKRTIIPIVSAAAAALIIAIPIYINSQYEHFSSNKKPEKEQVTEITTSVTSNNDTAPAPSDENDHESTEYQVQKTFEPGSSSANYELKAGKDCVYLYGNNSNNADITSTIYDTKKSEEIPFMFNIPNIRRIYKLLYSNNRIYVYYTDQHDDKNFAVVDDVSGNIIVLKPAEDYYSEIIMDNDGNLIAFSDDSNGNITRTVFDPENLEVKSETVSKYSGYSIDMMITTAFHNSDNSDCLFYRRNLMSKNIDLTVLKISDDGNIEYSERIDTGSDDLIGADNFYRNLKGNICFISNEATGNAFINEIDPSTCKVISKKNTDTFDGYEDFIFSNGTDELFYKDINGIYKYDEASGASKRIITFGDEIDKEYRESNNICCSDGKILLYKEDYKEGISSNHFIEMDHSGKITNDFSEEFNNTNVSSSKINKDGDILVLKSKMKIDDRTVKASTKYSLDLYDSNQNLKSSVDITKILNGLNSSISYLDLNCSGDIMLYISLFDSDPTDSNNYLYIISNSGELKSKTKMKSNLFVLASATSEKGDYLLCVDFLANAKLLKLDCSTGKTEKIKFDIPDECLIFDPVDNYDFCYVTNENKIYGFLAEENRSELLFESDDTLISADSFGDTIYCMLSGNDNKSDPYICVVEK